MLTIRKRNFESQQCYCCTGIKANICDPNSSVVYILNHKLPDKTKHIKAQVVVPRCKYCADKMKPIMPISIIVGIVGGIGGFLYTFSSHGILISLVCGIIWVAAVAFVMLMVLNFAFSIVYNQMESNYEIVNVLCKKYGWQTDDHKKGDCDLTFTDNRINEMLEDLVDNYECEYEDI